MKRFRGLDYLVKWHEGTNKLYSPDQKEDINRGQILQLLIRSDNVRPTAGNPARVSLL